MDEQIKEEVLQTPVMVTDSSNPDVEARVSLYEYLRRPDVTAQLASTSEMILKKFRGNSFTLEDLIKKRMVKNSQHGQSLIVMLELKGFLIRKTFKDRVKYSVSVGIDGQIELLKEQLLQMDVQRNQMALQLQELLAQKEILETTHTKEETTPQIDP